MILLTEHCVIKMTARTGFLLKMSLFGGRASVLCYKCPSKDFISHHEQAMLLKSSHFLKTLQNKFINFLEFILI